MREVSRRSGVPYNSISGILNGRLIQPANLTKIETAIDADPEPLTPEEFFAQASDIAARPCQNKISHRTIFRPGD